MFPVSIASYGIAWLRRFSRLGFGAVLVSAVVLLSLAPLGASAASFAAKASLTPNQQYLNDTVGTVFTLSVRNTGTVSTIGAVKIKRPFDAWTVTACPSAPAGWTATLTPSRCIYTSAAGTADDILPGQTRTFTLRATTAPGTDNRSGTWTVVVSRKNSFGNPSNATQAGSMAPGLTTHVFSFQILRAVIASGPAIPGAPCPAPNSSAPAASTGHTIVICGRNRTTATRTLSAAYASLGGTFIASHGSFSSGPIAPSTTSRVLGNWSNVTITSSPGAGKTVVAHVGSTSFRTSPKTTLTGFTALADPAPYVTSTSPADGATHVAVNSNVVVNFSESVTVSNSSFKLECPTGTPETFSVSGSPGSSITLDPTGDLPKGTVCTVTAVAANISDTDTIDPYDHPAADYSFSFTTDSPPAVTTTTPTDGATNVDASANITVNFNENVDVTTSSFSIECPAPGNTQSFTLGGSGTSTITINPTSDLPGATLCTVTIVAANVSDSDTGDPPDHPAANYSFSFTTTDAAPSVTSTSPADADANVAVNANIVVNFSEPVTATTSSFTLECPTSTSEAFTVSGSPGSAITLDPTSDLPQGTVCAVKVVANQISDVDAVDPPDHMAADYNFSFTTDSPPAVTTTDPADGGTGVDPTANITVNFNEAVNVDTTSFTISCDSNSQTFGVTGSGTSAITLNPDSDLPSTASCTVTAIAANISDTDTGDPPDHPASNMSFSFTTQDAAPSVTSTTPADAATEVARDTAIDITFSESVSATNNAFSIECPTGTPETFTQSSSPATTITLTPDANLPAGTACTVNVAKDEISDTDAVDPPDHMAADYAFSFTTKSNSTPTDISLSNSSIAENEPSGTDIGTLTTTDPDSGDTHTYTLENTGCGGGPFADNSSFQIGGVNSDKLQSAASFDFETKSSYTICVRSTDSGSASFDKQFTISVTNVNEAPTDISLTNNNIDENQPSGTAVGTLSQTGDPDSGETYTFTLLTSGCSGSFPDSSSFQISGSALQSAVSFNYEADNSYTICVRVNDPGSPNLSFSKQFTITINDINDAPVDGNESVSAVGNTLLEYGSVPSPSSAAKKVVSGNLLNNATDEDSPPQTLTISASDTTSAQGGTVSVSSSGAFSYVPAAGYTGSDTFNYTVSDGNGGTDTSTVTITVASRVWYVKNNATAGGTGRSTDPFDTLAEADTAANATGDITYVYKGDGTTTGLTGGFSLLTNQKLLGEPVNLVVGADTLATGTPANRPSLSGTVALASGSRVEGVDIAGSGGAAIAGTNTGGSDITNVNLSGGAGGVALTGAAAGTFNFTNFTISTTGGTGFLVNSSGAPTINVGSGSTENVSATGGPAVDVRNANGASSLAFDAVSSTNSSGAGINLDSNGATPFSASSGSISGAAGNAIDINGGSGNISYPGTLGNGAGNTADITGRTGGAITLSGDVNDTNDAGGGITMSGNTGGSTTFSGSTKTLNTGASAAFSSTGSAHTITFSGGGLNIDTTSGAGFSAIGGGTVNVTGSSNTIDSTTGTALNVSSTTIGASGLNFQSISANGGSNGIVLSNTGASGGLTVTGNGGTCTNADTSGCSGGQIRNTTGTDDSSATPVGTGIVLNNTQAPSLTRMWLHDNSNYAIRGNSVSGFTLANSVINGTNGTNGTDPFSDASVSFNNLTGSASVSSSDIRGGYEDNFRVFNTSGSLDRITFSSDTFGDNNATNGNDAVELDSTASASAFKATIQNSTFTAAEGDLLNYVHNGSGLGDLVVTGNAFSNNHPGIATGGGGLSLVSDGAAGATTMSITNNTFRDAVGPGVLIVKTTGTSTQNGTFSGNTIGVSGTANSGSAEGSALKLQTVGQGTMTWSVTNNFIYGYNNNGIEVEAGGGASAQSGAINTTITGNTIAQPGNTAGTITIPKNGIQFNIGTVPGDTYQACGLIGGAGSLANSLSTSGADGVPATGGGQDIRLRQRQSTTIRLPGYAGTNNDNTAVQTFVAGNNGGDGVPSVIASNTVPTGGGFTGSGTTCP